jgi:predicted O-methyltransferase YrrM
MPPESRLRKQARRFARIAADPQTAWTRFCTRVEMRIDYARPRCRYAVEPEWERTLHRRIGADFPCAAGAEFAALWPQVAQQLIDAGHRFGPLSYYGWNDGDPELVRAIWCLVRHLKPAAIVETGVGHGITTRFVLEALERNGHGRLWSIDLPPPDPVLAADIGVAVRGFPTRRWELVRGSARHELPRLLARIGALDLFIHDSLHTSRHVRFEIEAARRHLNPGGLAVIDDIDSNHGFRQLLAAHPGDFGLVCQSEPVAPDLRRFDRRGLFGVIQPASGPLLH